MPTKKYVSAQEDFANLFSADFDIDSYQADQDGIVPLDGIAMKNGADAEKAQRYANVMAHALMLYMEGRVRMGEAQYYDMFRRFEMAPASTTVKTKAEAEAEVVEEEDVPEVEEERKEEEIPYVSLDEFLLEFENLMQEKYASDLAEGKETKRDRKPFEGMEYGDLARLMLNRIHKYDRSLSDIWAEKITEDISVMETLKSITDEAVKQIDASIAKIRESFSAEPFWYKPGEVKSLATAKKTMDKVIAGRSVWWILNPMNWRRNWQERSYRRALNRALNGYRKNGLTEALQATILGEDERSVLHGTSEALEKSIVEQKALEQNPKPVEKAEVVKETVNSNEARVNFADPTIMATIKEEIDNAIDFSKVNSPLKTSAGMKGIWMNQIYGYIHSNMKTIWEQFENANDAAAKEKVLANGAKTLFMSVKSNLSMLQISTSVDSFDMAQKITDAILQKYSPVALDEKYAQYGKQYFIKNAVPEDLIDKSKKPGTTEFKYHFNIHNKFLTELRTELGLIEVPKEVDPEPEKEQVLFEAGELDGAVKDEKTENKDQKEPQKEEVKEEKKEEKKVSEPQNEEDEDDLEVDDEDEEPDYEEELDKELENLPPVPAINPASNCKENGELLMGNKRFMTELKKDILKILDGKLYESTDQKAVVEGLCNALVANANRINALYDQGEHEFGNRIDDRMEDLLSDVSDKLPKNTMPTSSRLVVAQQISDLMLNKATAIGFHKDELAEYSHNYAVNDNSVLHGVVSKLAPTEKIVQRIMEETRKQMADLEKESVCVHEANEPQSKEVSAKVNDNPVKVNDKVMN